MLARDLDTPNLLLDLDAMEHNISKMADFFSGKKADLRPHVKPHKSPAIAWKQIEAGAKGVTCAKLGEAETMALSGINDILIANEIVGQTKVERLMNLSERAEVIVAVDNEQNARELSDAAKARGHKLGVLLDLNLGKVVDEDSIVDRCGNKGVLDRCGVLPGKPALEFAQILVNLEGLTFRGLMGYEGGLRAFVEYEQRKEACENGLKLIIETRDLLMDNGIYSEIVSAGGSSTYSITGSYPGITEVQAGSYVLMDTFLRRMDKMDFRYAISVLTTIISRPYPEKGIIDVGLKGICRDNGLPIVKDTSGVEVISLNLEHGHLILNNSSRSLNVGDKIELLPSDADTLVNLYDKYSLVRNGSFVETWDVAARGKVQ